METSEVAHYVKPTLDHLKQIKADRKAEIKRRNLAIDLGICPECGASMKSRPPKTNVILRRFLPNKVVREGNWDSILECPKDSSHYNVTTTNYAYDENCW